MPDIDAISEQSIKFISSISKGAQLYPPTHPAVITPLNNVSTIINDILKGTDELKFGIVNDLLFFDEHVFYDENSSVKQLLKSLVDRGIATISVSAGFSSEDLFEALKLLSAPIITSGERVSERDILIEKGITTITIKYVDEEEDIEAKAKKTYFDAIDVVESTFNEVRMGRIPKLAKTKAVVNNIVDVVFTDHNAMLCLTMIKDYDNYTFNHSVNVSILAISLAKALGYDEDMVNEIGTAALLHDIGKTKTDKNIILKPGKLTDDEFSVIKKHPEKGYEILQQMDGLNQNTMDIVLQHHVHYDKKGYPKTDADTALNKYTTLITTADTYDAITTFRPYQRAVTPKEAIDIMVRFIDKYYEEEILRKFIETLGVFPTGSFVRLDTNEIALITKQNPEAGTSPIAKIVIDKNGDKLDEVIEANLNDIDDDGNKLRSIVSAIDPTFMGLNLLDYV
ncbi:HD-GYP domain-containing protein [Thermodesulfobacteriota bacterium]